MQIEALLRPVSEAEPAGPDLELSGDSDYGNYVMAAAGRLPETYFDASRDTLFDRGSIDIAGERSSIDALLARSRDIRLLALLARIEATAGDFLQFCQALVAMAAVVETFWPNFHPVLQEDDDAIERQNIVEGLDSRSQIVLPLHYAPIAGATNPVTWRQYQLATGSLRPREGEAVPSLDMLEGVLAAERNGARVLELHAALIAALSAIETLRATFTANVGHLSTPAFTELPTLLSGVLKLLAASRPELAGKALPAGLQDDADETPANAGGPVRVSAAPQFSSRGAAAQALAAVESYFLRFEPSSPALILVAQARMLIGRPLVEALESLLQADSANAVLKLDSGLGFDLDLVRMKAVTESVLNPAAGADQDDVEDEPLVIEAPTRQDAADLMTSIEAFFRSAEPSSPVPLLLGRARSYLNKDFAAILKEILPPRA